MRNLFCIILAGLAFFSACKPQDSQQPGTVIPRDTSITAGNSYNELFFDSTGLEKFIANATLHDSIAMYLKNFYNGRNYQYAWFQREGIADYAATFIGMQNNYIHYSGDSSLY